MKHLKTISFTIYICHLILFSCNSEENNIQKKISIWINKEIVFPHTLEYPQQDSLWKKRKNKKYTILTVIDSSGCSDCKLNLYEWRKIIKQTDSICNNVSFLFIVCTKDIPKIEWIKKKNNFKYFIFYDPKDKMQKINNFLKDPTYKTFLLDQNNRVLIIGNPIGNEKLWNLYKTIITK